MPNRWVIKYTPRPFPVSGFAWGPIRASHGRDQLAAAVIMDYTGGERIDGIVFGRVAARFSKFEPGQPWSLPLDASDQLLASSPELDPTPGAYRRPDLARASAWRYRPDPAHLDRARTLRAAVIKRQQWER